MKKMFSTKASDAPFSLATFILRVGAGGIILGKHGFGKMLTFSEKAATFADPFDLGPSVSLGMVVFAEFFCAALIVLGLFTRFACIPLIIAMTVALGHAHKWRILGDGSGAAIFLVCFLSILFLGPGKFSLDKFIGK
ncbi:MAG: DoxX family protein [Chitinophagaceae bacterium]